MRIVNDLSQSPTTQETMLTIGAFDGIHLGHQAILQQLVERAEASGMLSGMITFDPHPRQVLRPESKTELLTTLDEKTVLVRQMGLGLMIVIPFTPQVAATTADGFVRLLCQRLRLRHLIVGQDFAFGRGGQGNVQSLRELGQSMGFAVHAVEPVLWEGQPVSSTQIRALLKGGRVVEAAQLLGRRYHISGEIVHGAGRGRRLGFPTANLHPPAAKLVPVHGVYVACTQVDGLSYHAVVNIGVRPSFDNGHPTIEAHLLDFDGDLYGRMLRLEFSDFLRPEQHFSSVDALIAQIQRDCHRARQVVCAMEPG